MYSVIVKKKKEDGFEQIGGATKVEDAHLGSLMLHIINELEGWFDTVSISDEFNDANELVSAEVIGGQDPAVQVEISQSSSSLDPYRERLNRLGYYITRSYLEYQNQNPE